MALRKSMMNAFGSMRFGAQIERILHRAHMVLTMIVATLVVLFGCLIIISVYFVMQIARGM